MQTYFNKKVNQLKKNERLLSGCEYLKLMKLFYKEIWKQFTCHFFYKTKQNKISVRWILNLGKNII